MSFLIKKLPFLTIFSQISFKLTQVDIHPHCWQYQEGKTYLNTDLRGVGTHLEFLASLQGREKGRAEWRRSWKRSFVELRRAKTTPVNTASRIRTLQNWQMSSRLRKK